MYVTFKIVGDTDEQNRRIRPKGLSPDLPHHGVFDFKNLVQRWIGILKTNSRKQYLVAMKKRKL